jgi:iron complex transport system ATP-binding protein
VSLRLDTLSVDIGTRRIVDGIDLTVSDQEFAGLVGPNGSGKSTILKAIYRVHRPSAGRILLDGTNLLSLGHKDTARRIAVVTQESASEFDFTVREMVMIGRTPHKRSFERDTDTDHDIVDHAMDRVGCGRLASRRFNTLSGGEKQLVLIARALAQQADHLILDEPTNHLDIHHQVEILEVVSGLGVTVLAALHDLSLAALFCQAIHVLRAGQLVAAGAPAAVLTPETIRQAYGAEVLVIDHPDTGTPHLIPRRIQPAGREPRTGRHFPGPASAAGPEYVSREEVDEP